MIPIAPYPAPEVQCSIAQTEWKSIQQVYARLLSHFLRLSDKEFTSELKEHELPKFLLAYIGTIAYQKTKATKLVEEDKELRKKSFLLVHRTLSLPEKDIPSILWSGEFLTDLANAFPTSTTLKRLFSTLWKRSGSTLEEALLKLKASVVLELRPASGDKDYSYVEKRIHRLAVLFLVCSRSAELFVTGSDFLDSLVDVYPSGSVTVKSSLLFRNTLLRAIHTAFWQILNGGVIGKGKDLEKRINYSLIVDHIHQLLLGKAGSKEYNILEGLVNETGLLKTLHDHVDSNPESDAQHRLGPLLSLLQQYKKLKPGFVKATTPKPVDNGLDGVDANGSIQMPMMQQHITYIKEVFPELRDAWVTDMLEQYGGEVESVIRDILEGKLIQPEDSLPSANGIGGYLPQKRNIFDNDELDNLTVSMSKIHVGRRHKDRTADDLLHDTPNPEAKAAIYSALAAFDSDEDERDDTYDQADVGRAVDSSDALGDAEAEKVKQEAAVDGNEKILWEAYQRDKSLFGSSAAVKRSNDRDSLRKQTGWTDEGIQGWAIMLEKDPRRMKSLESKYSLASSIAQGQTEIPRTAYRRNPDEEESDINSAPGRGRGGFRGRGGWESGWGRGASRGGRGGGGSGGDSKAARARKDQNKARRGNHGRKEAAARKMARGGGFPGPS